MRFLLFCLIFSTNFSFAAIEEFYSIQQARDITKAEFLTLLPSMGFIVMGEYHNDHLIQEAQAEVIKSKTNFAQKKGSVALHWEFLNFTDQAKIDGAFTQLESGAIDSKTFIDQTAGSNNQSYAVIFDELKSLGADIYGINLPRAIKQKVINDGIGSVDPIYIPPHHYTGDENYRERFTAAMGNHVPANKIEDYFVAQCLTDSMMAHQSNLNNINDLNFIIAGSFHTDFYDGTVVRLQKLSSSDIKTIKFINLNNITEAERKKFIAGHAKYGHYADYLIFVK